MGRQYYTSLLYFCRICWIDKLTSNSESKNVKSRALVLKGYIFLTCFSAMNSVLLFVSFDLCINIQIHRFKKVFNLRSVIKHTSTAFPLRVALDFPPAHTCMIWTNNQDHETQWRQQTTFNMWPERLVREKQPKRQLSKPIQLVFNALGNTWETCSISMELKKQALIKREACFNNALIQINLKQSGSIWDSGFGPFLLIIFLKVTHFLKVIFYRLLLALAALVQMLNIYWE